MPDSTYAPQSPDLSSFLSASPPKQAQTSSYVPRSPNLQAFAIPVQQQTQSLPGQAPQYLQQQNHSLGFGDNYQQWEQQEDPNQDSYLAPIPDLPPSHTFDNFGTFETLPPQQQQYQSQPTSYLQSSHPFQSQLPPQAQFQTQPQLKQEEQFHQYSSVDETMTTRVKRERKLPTTSKDLASIPMSNLGPSQGIEIKTKFPVARIKRIMQADEEVGKVAQVTPVAVSKALELFMISLVTRSASLARDGNSKRVTAQHLKRAIEGDSQFDFLDEIVGKVIEGPEAGGKRVKDDDDTDEDEAAGKKKAKGRRKKVSE